MPPVHLAQELLDCIVDQVQDRRTLKACSVVARSLVGSSQRRLFRILCLFTDQLRFYPAPLGIDHPTALFMSFEKALDLFTISPHLGSYATDVYLGLLDPQDSPGVVESVLRMVSQLTVLGIFHNNSGFYRWSNIPPSLADLLKDTVLRLTVHSMRLERIVRVPSCFILFPSFRALSLLYVTVKNDITSTAPANAAYLRTLEHLTITLMSVDHSKSVIEMGMQGHLIRLRTLSLRGIEDGWMRFLLKSDFRQSLEHLELSFNTNIRAVLELPPFLALKSLAIEFNVYTPVFPPTLESALDNIHTIAPLLQYLSLAVTQWRIVDPWPEECEPYTLFASLDFLQRLPALREIHCSLEKNDEPEANFERYIGNKFPGPKEAGILTCSTKSDSPFLPLDVAYD
ncbi:hypothetical protein C8R44DRAFT_980800 [Mycena epipterygia]|nr:hypothetical protein C8R44DRAFT_980800 [Mycena epipterygia]